MIVKCAIILLIFAVFEQAVGTDITDHHENPQDKPAIQQKGRLSLQNTAEIQHCLVNAGDVGCGVFECFENNSCEIRGLQEICMTFLHNAGKFDSQGKSFIKDALKCMAHGLRHRFSCISRKCPAIKDMVFQLQRECYIKHNLCSAAKDNVNVMVEMIHFQDLFPKGQEEHASQLTPAPEPRKQGDPPHRAPAADPAQPPPESERDHPRTSRQGEREKGGKAHAGPQPRSRGQGSRRSSIEADKAEQDEPETTDIRR
ncbi:stanniocalcin-2 isoform X2 [Lepisosteus oculatus]|uniref:stanniocalcin-2 isoform X2 n=1 Tax=Lepisosteus oculatus TaxID=7918 RepID=UPI0007403403|nr:PREDICTED: stanniocalcin-2 isoform X2 [Lepisosteus oculatus]